MIVKNEAARIERCLLSVAPHICCWAISDTGSTDETPDLINKFFAERGVPGVLSHDPFVDFSTSRNRALDLIPPMEFDYHLLIDADMELVVEDPRWVEDLTAPAYLMIQRGGSLSYHNVRLLRRGGGRYHGVTHEYISAEGREDLDGAYFVDHADGANRPGKFERDIALLEAEMVRNVFYAAQSYRDLGDYRRAAELYAQRQKMGSWEEERWYATLQQSRCLRALGE